MAYIAAVLEANDYDVSIMDALALGWREKGKVDETKIYVGLSFKEISSEIKRLSPDIVGISVPFSTQIRRALKVAAISKIVDKDIITILGGPHPSIRPLDCLSCEDVDFVVIGEGENTLLELIQKFERGEYDSLKEVKGIAYKENEKTITTFPRPLVQDLDSIPFPARHLLPMEEYFAAARAGESTRNITRRWATVITSRGCPYNCVFCSIHSVMGRKWRVRSPENVISEIEELVHTYRIKHIDFEDDNMTLNKKRVERICQLIIKRGLDIEWSTPNGVRADTLDEDLLRKMKKSGCRRIMVAPESGDQRVVNQIIKKKLDLKKVEEVVTLCKKVGIGVDCSFVIGLIGETKEDIKRSIDFARRLHKLGADYTGFHIATPYYGTELYEQAKQRGYLSTTFDDDVLSTREPLIETPEFTAEEICQLRAEAEMISNPLATLVTRANLSLALDNPRQVIRFVCERLRLIRRR